ncbi:xanthine dehydrogenase family protein molybdopterin-binding subunit [Nocardioides mangrovicus]|uniref:Xanthine dehydrogenase family protein molybdopterin-binding subunit n=1 Tax=Nocardioides mangrovicus TaxID=2478913 RepID=A0A3L8P3K0_9ACTN|nr:xanthine dehydrogenase family protein molybdopterin-binding subunit [Nocardioides mangrovicus]RLV49363.1 xanthine dehydrogenase family protein molybdopterin-binding subunit [Nocardioides mangrovicus]
MVGSLLGNAVPRVEDPDLITGASTYVDDLRIPGTVHAVFVRSPFAHARITGLDTTEAAAAPGVLAVYTTAELGSDRVPGFADVHEGVGHPPLAHEVVRYVGDPVALVVAETRAQAVDAAELVDVDYDELPVVADMEAALADDAPLQFPDLGTNVVQSVRAEHGGEDPFAGAEVIVRARIENQRLATSPIEGNAVLADPRPEGDALITVYAATQHPHMSRDLVARWTGLEKSQVRLVAPHVGGAFGGKAGIAYGHAAVIAAARRLERPVTWAETRSEAMLSMHGRGQVQFAEMGFRSDGTVTGLRARVIGDCGAYAGFGGTLAVGPTHIMAQGPYEIPVVHYAAVAVMTNTAPNGAFRGAGRPEAAAMLERLMDLGAAELGLAPEEVRRRNLIAKDAFPYTTRTGQRYDVGDYDVALGEALRLADVDALRAEQRQRRDDGAVRQLGVGVSTYVEITGFGGKELGSVRVEADGSATVMSGTSAHGQGHATSFAMIVSSRLGIAMERIRYVQSDTFAVRSGGGTGGSRSLQLGGSAVSAAARDVYHQAAALAARKLEASVDDISAVDGGLGVAGVPGSLVTWEQLVGLADGTLRADLDVPQEGATFPFGAHVSVVEVDTETGLVTPLRHVAVDDCGRILNPTIVKGQQHGGIVQGMSQALWEGFVYDAQGTPLTSTFTDYSLPTAADAITMEATSTETPTDMNELGAKGIGESGTIGSTPAVQSAVVDALAHLGVRHVDIPCTPDKVWTAIEQARAGTLPDPWRDPPRVFDTLELASGPADGGVEA